MPPATARIFCPIKGFTVWTPDYDSMLDYDWEPLPKPPSACNLRHSLAMKRKAAATQELAFLRERCAVIEAVLRAEGVEAAAAIGVRL